MIKYYDIGINLFTNSYKDEMKIINDARDAGVECILTGSSGRENELVNEFTKKHDVYGTAGIHPHEAENATEKNFKRIEKIIKTNDKIIAVGECGLDYNRMFSEKEVQLTCFKRHIELAVKLDKPLFLHMRDADEDFIKCFEGYENICKKSVVHCYTSGRKTLEVLLEMGFYIGITGWICDERRADELRNAVEIIPKERLLLETDSPYLTPRGRKLPRTNVPQNIVYVAQELAKYMPLSEEEIISNAKKNTEDLFGI